MKALLRATGLCAAILITSTSSCGLPNDAILEPPTAFSETGDDGGMCDYETDPWNCKLKPLSDEGRRFIYGALSRINRNAMFGQCGSFYDAVVNALERNAIAQWDNMVYTYDVATNTYKLVLGDAHPSFTATGQDNGFLHFYSGLWTNTSAQYGPGGDRTKVVLHEGVHRHYHSMGDLLYDAHADMGSYYAGCYSQDAMSKRSADPSRGR